MNLIDNGVKEVLNIDRYIGDEEMYFIVTFIDYYGEERRKKFNSIINLEKQHWME